MFNLAIDSKLRGCDVVSLKVEDVAPHGMTADRATIRLRKTGHPGRVQTRKNSIKPHVFWPKSGLAHGLAHGWPGGSNLAGVTICPSNRPKSKILVCFQ